jgi:hypothetical protein
MMMIQVQVTQCVVHTGVSKMPDCEQSVTVVVSTHGWKKQ